VFTSTEQCQISRFYYNGEELVGSISNGNLLRNCINVISTRFMVLHSVIYPNDMTSIQYLTCRVLKCRLVPMTVLYIGTSPWLLVEHYYQFEQRLSLAYRPII
jgi:hypothetical protein